jgi:hypothetical protein
MILGSANGSRTDELNFLENGATIWIACTAFRATPASLAAVLPQVVHQSVQRGEVGTIMEAGAYSLHEHQLRIRKAGQVMAEGGTRDADGELDFAHRGAIHGALDNQAEDPKPDRVAQGFELTGITFQYVDHCTFSTKS